MTIEIEILRRQKAEIEDKINKLEKASLCKICDGVGVLRSSNGGFAGCFGCTGELLQTILTKNGRYFVWNDLGIGLLFAERKLGWGGNLEKAWFKSDALFSPLTELLERRYLLTSEDPKRFV